MTFGAIMSRIGALPAVLLLAACTTSNIEDIAPTSLAPTPAAAPLPEPRALDARDRVDVPALQEDYPDLNTPPQAAAPQFTDAQRRAEADALAARRDGLGAGSRQGGGAADLRRLAREHARDPSGAGVSDRSEELRRLARTHGERAIEAIEGE